MERENEIRRPRLQRIEQQHLTAGTEESNERAQ